MPTTLQAQAEADAQLREIPVPLFEGIQLDYPGPFAAAASSMVSVFGQDDPPGLATTLHANIDQAVDNASVGGPDGAFHFEDLLPSPEGNFDAQAVLTDVEGSFGGCAGFCLALGASATDCQASCADEIGTIEEPQLLLHSYVVALIDTLDLGIACQRRPSELSFLAIEGEPSAFFLSEVSALLEQGVPALYPVFFGSAALILAAAGAWRIRR